VKHVFVKAAARLNNRAENSHQPTRECERRMRDFRDPKRTQKFLSQCTINGISGLSFARVGVLGAISRIRFILAQ
jgi:hypothetical protein